jgi:hypothetical protein
MTVEEPEAEGRAPAETPLQLGELVGGQSVLLLRVIGLLAPGLAAVGASALLEEVWADYLASLFDAGAGGPVTSGLLAVLVNRCRALAGPAGGGDEFGPDPIPAERFRPDQDRWAGAWQVGRGPRAWAEDARRPAWTREAVESLPLPVREVLVLRDIAGLSTGEVGTVLQRPDVEVRSLLHRARASVWVDLERRHVEAGCLQPPVTPVSVRPAAPEPYPGDAGHQVICRQLVELLTGYLDGSLDGRTTADLEAHLVVCPECRLFVQQVQTATTESGRLAAVHSLPAVLVETVVRQLRQILKERQR